MLLKLLITAPSIIIRIAFLYCTLIEFNNVAYNLSNVYNIMLRRIFECHFRVLFLLISLWTTVVKRFGNISGVIYFSLENISAFKRLGYKVDRFASIYILLVVLKLREPKFTIMKSLHLVTDNSEKINSHCDKKNNRKKTMNKNTSNVLDYKRFLNLLKIAEPKCEANLLTRLLNSRLCS